MYVAVIVDVCCRAILGWAAANHMRTSLVLDALTMAAGARRPPPGLIIHSDRGSQYTSNEWLQAVSDANARASMGRVGPRPKPCDLLPIRLPDAGTTPPRRVGRLRQRG
ncbi:MAG: DDE-type integrase/transposase/recombinase [Actinobacteria bacterium]|nr:DDE-type integrase/transposase/recombinase [Actinomycetota bacterium]